MPLNRLRRWLSKADTPADDQQEDEETPPPPPPPPTIVEWGARLMSLLFLLALAGVIVYQGTRPTLPPRLRLEADVADAEQRGEEWALPVTVINEGTVPLEEVAVTVQLVDGEEVVDEADLTFTLLGPGEQADAEVWFAEPPADHDVALDVVSYQLP